MAGPALPEDIDASYDDDVSDASVKAHQQHHDALHDLANNFDKDLSHSAASIWVYDASASVYVPRQQVPTHYELGVTQNANYTLILADNGKVVEMHDNTNPRTLTLPDESVVNFPVGSSIGIYQHHTPVLTIAPQTPANTQIVANVGGTAYTSDTAVFTMNGRYSEAVLRKRHSNGAGFTQWVLSGNIVAT